MYSIAAMSIEVSSQTSVETRPTPPIAHTAAITPAAANTSFQNADGTASGSICPGAYMNAMPTAIST